MPISATITVSFIAQYSGLHRVYYKLSTDPTYTFAGNAGPCGINTNCQMQFFLTVENESCDVLTYDIYVQPECFDEGSLDGRVEEQIQFIPDPACKRYTYTCESVGIGTVNITGGGLYDTPGLGPISVNAVSGGAVFDVTFDNLINGAIINITVTNAGSYTSGDLPPVLDWGTAGITENLESNLTFNLLNCPDLTITGCSDGAVTPGLALDETVDMCATGIPSTPPAGYGEIVPNGNCLCDCTITTLEETSDSGGAAINYQYIDCNGQAQSGTLGVLGTTGPICMVSNSLQYQLIGPATANVINGGPCDAV